MPDSEPEWQPEACMGKRDRRSDSDFELDSDPIPDPGEFTYASR